MPELFAGRHGNGSARLAHYRRLPEIPVHLLALSPAWFENNLRLPTNEHRTPELLPNLLGSFSELPDTVPNLAEIHPTPAEVSSAIAKIHPPYADVLPA
jgi:hypothetical protein